MRRLLAVAAGCALVGASTITTESMSPEAQVPPHAPPARGTRLTKTEKV